MAAKTLEMGFICLAFHRKAGAFVLAAARRAAAGVALHAGAVADQRVVAAFPAGFALVALHLCFGTGVHADCAAGHRCGRPHAGRD